MQLITENVPWTAPKSKSYSRIHIDEGRISGLPNVARPVDSALVFWVGSYSPLRLLSPVSLRL